MIKNFKNAYIILALLMLIFLASFTCINVLVYGSVMQINIPILSLIMIFPLYLGFKDKTYYKHTVIILTTYLLLICMITLIIKPSMTFNEAKDKIESIGPTYEAQMQKHTRTSGFIYAGDYLIHTNEGDYTVDVNTGAITKMEVK